MAGVVIGQIAGKKFTRKLKPLTLSDPILIVMTKLSFPFTEEKVGDEVLISGVVFTGRGIGS
jgi:hypothetical protein